MADNSSAKPNQATPAEKAPTNNPQESTRPMPDETPKSGGPTQNQSQTPAANSVASDKTVTHMEPAKVEDKAAAPAEKPAAASPPHDTLPRKPASEPEVKKETSAPI